MGSITLSWSMRFYRPFSSPPSHCRSVTTATAPIVHRGTLLHFANFLVVRVLSTTPYRVSLETFKNILRIVRYRRGRKKVAAAAAETNKRLWPDIGRTKKPHLKPCKCGRPAVCDKYLGVGNRDPATIPPHRHR